MPCLAKLLQVLCVWCVCASSVYAGGLSLQWDPPADAHTQGYIIHYGTAPGSYSRQVNAGFVTTFRVDGLSDGTRYYFAVQAYSGGGQVSGLSAEVSGVTTGVAVVPGGGSSAPVSSAPAPSTPPGPTTPVTSAPAAPAPSSGSMPQVVTPAPQTTSPVPSTSGNGNSSSSSSSSAKVTVKAAAEALGSAAAAKPKTVTAVLQKLRKLLSSTDPGMNADVAREEENSLDVSWEAPSTGVPDGYRVEVGTTEGGTSVSAYTSGLSARLRMTEFPASTYFVRVRSVNGATLGDVSDEVQIETGLAPTPAAPSSGQCTAAPAPPARLSAGATGTLAQVSWQAGGGDAPTGYVLLVGSAPGRQDLLTLPVDASTTFVQGAAAPGIYALRLAAVNACGVGAWAAETLLRVGAEVPTEVPGTPTAFSQHVDGRTVTLTWSAPATGGPVTRYRLEVDTGAGVASFDTASPSTTYTHPNTPSGRYTIRVRAGNAAGFSAAASAVTVTVP